ncbi:MAG: methyltransferase domain-containing protein [Candidatus Nezhaarchaeota archaeon]|nr:methyltransferase domain-containing protein [Candidatus Nezhaarchaeota archaeon]
MRLFDAVRRYWDDRGAQIYDRLTEWTNREKLKSTLLRHLNVDKDGVVLDLGTGTGLLALLLAEVGYRRIIGLDINEHMLRVAKRKLARYSVELVQGDGMRLPIADGSVDAVVSKSALWMMPSPERAVEEMVRVTRPGGLVLALESSGVSKLRRPSPWIYLSGSPIRHLYLFYLEKVLGRGRGLTVEQFWRELREKLPLYSLDEYAQLFKRKGLVQVYRTGEEDYRTLREKLLLGGYKLALIRGVKPEGGRVDVSRGQEQGEDWLLKILACPLCYSGLAAGKEEYRCERCGRAYPIVDGIPALLPPEDLLR